VRLGLPNSDRDIIVEHVGGLNFVDDYALSVSVSVLDSWP
jgi:hypothetical protein